MPACRAPATGYTEVIRQERTKERVILRARIAQDHQVSVRPYSVLSVRIEDCPDPKTDQRLFLRFQGDPYLARVDVESFCRIVA